MKRLAFLALLSVLLLAGCSSQTVTPADKVAFLTVSDFRTFGYAVPKVSAPKWNKTAYADATYDVELEVETPDSEQNSPFYLSETLSDENTSKDAMTYLAGSRGAMNLILKSQKLTEKAVPKETIYGDGSSLTTLQSGKIVVGNIFSARKKGRTFSLFVVGVAFEDPKEWDDFAGKKIRAWLDGTK